MGTIPMPFGGTPTMGQQPPAGGIGTPGGGVFNIGPGGAPIPGGPAPSTAAGSTAPKNAFSPVGAGGQQIASQMGISPTLGSSVPTAPTTGTGAIPSQTPIPMSTAATTPLGVPTAGQVNSTVAGDPNNNLGKAEDNVYGSGLGGAITGLLGSIGGVDSASLQNYVASLQPVEAQAQATTNATLGAGGVSANSSVAAIADSNLQAQETGAIAGESAQLQQSGQQLEASILTGQEQAQAQATADSSPWAIFGDVVGGIGAVGKALAT